MVKLLQKFYIILCFSFIYSVNSAQLQVNNIGANADFLANVIAGQGVSISNATIVGHNQAYSTFNYNGTSYCVGGVSPNVPGILTGVLLTTGRANIAPGPNNNGGAGASNGTAGTALLGGNTFDAVVLEFDFVPSSDFISFRYVFGSEEYNEYVGSSFNDAFGFFVSGPNPLGGNYNDLNIALLPNSSVVSINNVNLNTNSAFYINNEAPNVQNNCVQYDGYTTVLTASANVIPCQTYRLKLAIADVGDGVYDSGVFIEENSLTSPSVSVSLSVPPVIGQNNVLYEGCDYLTMTLSIPNPVAINTTVNYTLGGTATNGTDYTGFPSSIVIPAGQTSTSFNITAFEDGIPEGVETIIVNVDITPCSTETFIIEIHDAQPLVVNTSNNVSVCFGATTADLTATANNPIGPVTYEWNPGALTGQNVTVTNPTNGQVFTVTATDLCGRTSNASTTVVFQPQIIPSAGPDQNICLGDNITLTGSGGTSYIWYQMPGNVQIGTGTNITVSPTATTTYMVEVFQGTCSETAEVTITVNPPPAAVASLSNNNICVGQSATLSASGATSYLWTANPPLPGLDPTATTQTVAPTQTTTFTLEATESGCTGESFVTLTVNPLPDINATASPVDICLGESTQLNAQNAVSYSWTANPSDASLAGQTNIASPTVSPQTTTTYSVTGVDGNGCSNSSTVTVNVSTVQGVVASSPTPVICAGQQTTLNGSGANTYQWTDAQTGVPVGSGASITVNPTSTTTYLLTGFVGTCSETAEVTITVNPPPAAVASLSNNNICVGQSATLSASGATSYLWTANPPLPGLDPTATTQTVAPTQTTTFTLEATESGCTGESSVTLTVNPLPDINATASPADICLGESTQLNAQNAVSYSWTANPSDASLAGQTNIASPTVSPQTTTTYSVTGVDGNGCSNSSTVTVNVSTVQGVVASSPTPVICAGQQTTLNGSGANTYQWTDAQTGVPVGSGASITVNPTSTTTYLLTGFVGTCSGTDQLTITVNPLPIVSANASNSPICNGQSTTLNASGAATYLWQANPVDPSLLPVSNTPNPTVTPTQTTTYNLVGIDANNCPNTASVTVVVNALPNVSATVSPTAICLNQSAQLNASGAVNYQWTATPSDASLNTQNTIANPTVTPNNTTTYQVMGTDANGCSSTSTITLTVNPLPNITATVSNAEICDGESTQLQASGASNYFWTSNPNDVTLQNQNTLMNPTVTPAIGTTTYSVTGTDSNNCSGSANVTVNVLPFANITVTPSSLSICEGETVTLTAQGGTTFTWTQNPMDASFQTSPNGSNAISSPIQNTTYTVTGSATGLCASSTDVSIEVRPQPNASFTVSGPVCERDDYAAINFTGNAIAGANFDWNFDNGNTANAGGFHNYLSMWSTPGSKNISLTITQNGCTHTVNQTIMVNPKPIASGTAQPAVGCEPLLVNFTNTSTYNNLPNNVTWFFGNGSSSNGLGNVSTVYQNAGAYDVTLMVENNFGCRDTVTYNNMVTVNPLPVALFNYMPDVITVNNPNISLLDNSINSVSCDYFINGVWVSNNCNYNHTFKDSGEYVIMQLVTSQDGCVDTMFQTVYVLPDGNIYIPNAFSPNGDGVNDIFKAEGFGVAEFKMEIYNRWGETLYTIDRIADGWDGKLNGVDLKQDVYVYRIEYSTTLDPKIKILIGRFNLLR